MAYHVLPRFSGHGIRGASWARSQFGLHLTALLLIVFGLGFGWSTLFAAGGVLMSVALALFAWTIWPTLRAITPRPHRMVPTVRERAP
ncbi:MAG: hypothetical protein HC822_12860 [Oscillochloris sp.]|nr:hypothetical protein [Oscillochloris sp.]